MRRRRFWRRFRRLLTVLVVLGAGYAGGFGLFLVLLPEPQVALPPVDGLVVFTGGSNRVVTGLEMVRDGFTGPVLISGVHPSVKMPELVALLKTSGGTLSPRQQSQISLDVMSESTNANVVNTLMWADAHAVKRIGVVTSTYHALRCRALFWWYGALGRVWIIPVQPAMVGYGPLLREYHKLLGLPFMLLAPEGAL